MCTVLLSMVPDSLSAVFLQKLRQVAWHWERVVLLVLLWHLACPSFAQRQMSWDEFVEYAHQWHDVSGSEEEDADAQQWLENIEELQQLTLHPININTASREELLTLPFLSEVQIDDIREYISRYHGMRTLFELSLVRSVGYFERTVLPLFVYAGTTRDFQPNRLSLKEMLTHQKHELQTRIDIPLYHRDGFLRENGYRGSRISNRTKYMFDATQHISASLHFKRDAGERGIDSYGGQVILKDLGHLAAFVAGDFRVGFGEGLVMNQGFGFGKSLSLSRSSQGLKAHRGSDEWGFLRGAGATLRFGQVSVSAFASRRAWDATLADDGSVKTIVKGGYHRTLAECGKKNSFHADMLGADVSWQNGPWHLGASGYYLHTSLPLNPGDALYRRIYPRGQAFCVMGANYGYEAYRWQFRGETAYSVEQGGLATLNSFSFRISNRYRLTASQRYYGKHYYSFFSSSLSENSGVQNETAATLRLDATPFDGLQLIAFADIFYNPWPRYGLTASSQGEEFVLQTQYSFNRRNQLSVRYSMKDKEYSSGRQMHHRLRLQWICQPNSVWRWQTTAMLHRLKGGSAGQAVGETLRYGQGTSRPLHFSLSAIYFHTSDYDSRISLYEPNVAGRMSIPSFYGHGVRLSGTLQWQTWKQRLHLEMKYGFTNFFDRDTQSSGLQTIYSNVKNDITLQLRLKI